MGRTLAVEALRTDFDADTLLIAVRPASPTAREGTTTCFGDAPLAGAARLGFLAPLARIMEQRRDESAHRSYTAKLFAGGMVLLKSRDLQLEDGVKERATRHAVAVDPSGIKRR